MSSKTHTRLLARQAGFTLLELVMVVTILSILFGIVFVGMTGATESERLASSARRLCSFVEDVRNTAICGQKRLYIVYLPEQGEVGVCDSLGKIDTAELAVLKRFKLADGVRISQVDIGDTAESGDRIVIEVSSQGDIQGHSIVLSGKSGSMTVKVDGVLGTARVEE
jgi:prepilin-type N-terminal cleavage/methylation domain-containing protein